MTSNRFLKVIGWGLILIGVVANQFVIEAVLVADGKIDSWVARGIILVFQITSVSAGILVLTRALPRLPPWLARPWVLATGSVAVSLLTLELALRLPALAWPWMVPRTFVGDLADRPTEHFIVDSLTGWRMRPTTEFRWLIDDRWSTYVANDVGFRTPYAGESGSSPQTIVLIGDSFAFGSGLDYPFTFGAILDSLLGDTRVYNMAMPGFGIDQMLMTARHYAIPKTPTAIVVAFIDHDLDRSLYAYRAVERMNKPTFVLDGDTLRPQTHRDRGSGAVTWLEGHSAIWNLGRHSLRGMGYRRPVGSWWKINQALFTSMWQEATQRGIPILFVRLPLRTSVPFPQLHAFMDQLGAPFVDLQDAMGSRNLHFATDEHIDEAGHLFVADRLAPVIRLLIDSLP